MNAKELLDHAIKSGAPLVAVHRISLFRDFARSSLHRLIRTGKLPALRVGRSYYSTPEIAAKALTDGSCINPLPSVGHAEAVANLERKGFGSKAGPTAKSMAKKSK
jgi:hypothetical protein